MNISYDYYRVFYYVAKLGNISQAAKVLMNNQPNLTRIIKTLESELGCPLFQRTNRGMHLTPEGEKMYSYIKIALENIEAGEAAIEQSRTLKRGTVFIAASEVALHCHLLPVFKKFRKEYPGIQLRISNYTTPQAIDSLKSGSADFAVVTAPSEQLPTLSITPVKNIREVAVCSPAFKDLLSGAVPLSALCQHPLISLGSETQSYKFYEAFFAQHGLQFRPEIEAFTADQILPMVEADLGIGFVPQAFLRNAERAVPIQLVEKIPKRKICLIKRKHQSLSVAAKELERMVMETDSADESTD